MWVFVALDDALHNTASNQGHRERRTKMGMMAVTPARDSIGLIKQLRILFLERRLIKTQLFQAALCLGLHPYGVDKRDE